MSIAVVLFDLGGVVARFRPERRLAALAAASGLPPGEVHARLWGSGFDAACDRGHHDADGAHREIAARLGLDVGRAALEAMWARAWEPDADVLALVDAARGGARTGLLTDNGPLLRAALPRLHPGVAARFDWLLFSCELGAVKPEPALFRRALARVGAPAEAVLLVDDAPPNVAGARAAGLAACLYRDPATLAGDLARHGLPVEP
jgi:putative hydrolase of the HAD superfamily